ncbi:MAG: tyrosine-type recombinase/integrase [Bryobacteraceae bacterium]
MAVYKRGNVWWYEFFFNGERVRESAKTSRKTLVLQAEKDHRLRLEKTLSGVPLESRDHRVKSVAALVTAYLKSYRLNHRSKSIAFAEGRLAHVTRLLGGNLLPDLTEATIVGYIESRMKEKVSGRTINMELGELSRAIGRPWSELWPKLRKLEERKDVGKALAPEEERRLLNVIAADESPNRSRLLGMFVRIALLTGMRSGEILNLTWGQLDFERRVLVVGRAKTSAGTGRQIPMNADLFSAVTTHATWFANRFEAIKPELYLFPFGKPTPNDATRPTTTMKTSWATIRKRAGLDCRLHDLRHTAATKMAEAGVPESTMLAIMGHMSRAMLERYSHIRMAAKRQAVESLSAPKAENAIGVPTNSPTVTKKAPIN